MRSTGAKVYLWLWKILLFENGYCAMGSR